ncbi:MAG: tRNA pseudouridine(55) synthase TruB [Pseudomonadota bacterium]
MSRRKTARDVDGWLIVDKPEGVGSTAVVGRARWAFNARKAGHAGTLDPLATGLVAIAFGGATKIVPFAQDGLKTYRFTVRWGVATTTDDREGEVAETSENRPTAEEIEAALPAFRGEVMQTPPVFSAVKVAGERAYDLARKGRDVSLAPRPILIERLELIERPDADHAVFEMVCGKGGYVRSVGRDLGRALGTCAHVTALRRVSSGAFTLDHAVGYDELERLRDDPAADARLAPARLGLGDMPEVSVGAAAAERLSRGIADAAPAAEAPVYWASHRGAPPRSRTAIGAPRWEAQ